MEPAGASWARHCTTTIDSAYNAGLSLKQRTNTCHRYQQNLRTSAAESCAAQFSCTTSSHLMKSARSSYYANHKFGTGAHDRHQNDRHQTGIKGHCNCTLHHQLGINLVANSVPSNAKNGSLLMLQLSQCTLPLLFWCGCNVPQYGIKRTFYIPLKLEECALVLMPVMYAQHRFYELYERP